MKKDKKSIQETKGNKEKYQKPKLIKYKMIDIARGGQLA